MATNSQLLKYVPPVVLLAVGFLIKNGLPVELAINWLLLLIFAKKDIRVLGLLPTTRFCVQLMVAFCLSAIFCAFNYWLQGIFSGAVWAVNQSFTLAKFFSGFWWTMQSVLFEELIFRGALLYISIQWIGEKRAIWLSAICFGVYHWFSMGAFGNFIFMVYLFAGTGIMGYIFALGYAKTQSLYLPTGLHFGWNLVNNIIFSNGPNGRQFLTATNGERFTMFENIIVLLLQFVAFPLAAFLYIRDIAKNPKSA